MWSLRLRLSCLCFLIFFCIKNENTAFMHGESCAYNKQSQMFYQMIGQNTTILTSPDDGILDFLNDHVVELQFPKYQEVVFVIGAKDSDKINTVSLITGAELEVIETKPCDFRLVDRDGSINQYPSNVDSELIPQLLTDKERGVDYYVLPSFNVERDVKNDLTAWHLIQRTLQFATGVKFMLTLTYPAKDVERKASEEGIRSVRHLVRNTNLLINDIEKYSDAISLVVTNVKNDPSQTDTDEIQHVAYVLRATIDVLVEELDKSTDNQEESNALNKDIRLLEVLLVNERRYKRINIMRLANETGLVSDMTVFQNEKVEIMSMVRRNTKYVSNVENDFFFNILNETRAQVPNLINEMKARVASDISNIENAIKSVYEKFEDDLSDLNVLFNKMKDGYQEISQIRADDLKSLLEEIIFAVNNLKLDVSLSTLDDTLKNIELYKFLISVAGHDKSSWFLTPDYLIKTITYLNESKTWYAYLLKLQDILSEFSVQKNVKEYVEATANVMSLCRIDTNEERKVSDIGLSEFLQTVGIEIDPAIENIKVNSFKLEKLREILQCTMYDYGTLFCLPNKVLVKGYNVKISDVIEMNCPGDITFLEIFVLNNLFIDADLRKVGIDLQLAIIAPKWEVIGKRKITLQGKAGEAHAPATSSHGTDSSSNGIIGLPGKSGFSAGCFLAVGDKFINDEQLEVHLVGGKGGPGQHGGNGLDGVPGDNPPLPEKSYSARSTWDNKGFPYVIRAENMGINIVLASFLSSVYIVNGLLPNTVPGEGANGGKGGFGGLTGETFFVGINQEPKFTVFNNVGPNGAGGRGGTGGKATYAGDIYVVRYLDAFVIFIGMEFGNAKIMKQDRGNYYSKGKDGLDNKNDVGIKEPIPARFINTTHSINSYKSFLRENLAGNIRESTIRAFMFNLESNDRITSLYRTMDYVNELESLEDHYLLLRDKLPVFQFYESLKNRLTEYSKSTEESADHKKILNFLHASVLGKLSHLRAKENLSNFRNKPSIIDLLEYLEIVQKNILKMEQVEAEVSVAEQTDEYQNALQKKIDAALEAVNTRIIPVISQLFDPLASSIMNLLDNVMKQRDKAKKDQEELEAKLQSEKMLGAIKALGTVLNVFGGIGQALGTFLQIATDVYMGFQQVMQVMSQLARSLETITNGIKDYLKNPFRLYLDQMDVMLLQIAQRSEFEDIDSSVTEVAIQINNYKDDVKKLLKSNTYANVKKIYEMRGELAESLKKARITCKQNCLQIDKAAIVNGLKKIGKDLWDQIKNDDQKTKEMYIELNKLENQFNMWEARADQIQEKLLPMLLEVEGTMEAIIHAIGNKTHVELDITAWNVQTTMGDFKLLVRQMYDQISCPDGIVRLIEKIEETFNVMITIFDRIQTFKDQSEFAGFVAGVQSPNNRDISNPALRNVVTKLKRVLQSNLVLEQYDLAIHSFKQHFFPFAVIHLAIFDLPSSLQINDTQVLVRRASEEISYLQDQLKFLEVSLGRYDREIFGDIYFRGANDVSITKPFYIFKSREYKDLFRKLLSGDEIMVRADIAKGLKQNAIKFNEIGIQMKLINELMQEEFDDALKYFGVRMTLTGHVYYKCDDQFYYLPVDDNVVIEYSFKMDENGKPMKYNDVYRKLREKHYFLSPYAAWRIQLTVIDEDFYSTTESTSFQKGFKKLTKFVNQHFNIELVGRGQYFRSKGTLEAEICTDVVKNYYEFDKASSDVSGPQRLSFKYLL